MEPVAVVRKLAIQEAMDRFSRSGNLPAIFMAVAVFTLDSNEFRLGTLRSQRFSNPLTLRDVHIVIAGSVDREERNVGSRKCHRGDVAKLGVRPRSTMTHHFRQNVVEF